MGPEYYRTLLDPLYAGRRWIVTADTASGATRLVERIVDAGADAVMVVAGHRGTGPPPPAAHEVFVVGTTASTIMEGIRAFAAALTAPSPELYAAVDAFDPTREAGVVSGYRIPSGEICGRPISAAVPPGWKALEDKLMVDALWDRSGVARVPARVVAAKDEAAMRDAVREVAGADGAVVVADNREGWHGGGEYTRYVAPGADGSATFRFFARHANRVRIMAYLRGVPCSIHGLVAGDAVLAFRPVEMLVFRRPHSDEFVYGGVATLWDPPSAVRKQMRSAARNVGRRIRDEVGYRGAFGIDGVCTSDGFFPTELNPRLTPGLRMQADTAGGYPMGDIDRAVVAGLDLDLRLDELERDIVAGADATRSGRWLRPITHLEATETAELPIAYDGATWSPAPEPEATAIMSFGPSPQGSLVYVKLVEDHGLAPGASIADIAASSFAVADDRWDTRIGGLIAGTVAISHPGLA